MYYVEFNFGTTFACNMMEVIGAYHRMVTEREKKGKVDPLILLLCGVEVITGRKE